MFSRQRKLTLKRLIFFIMTIRSAVQRDLDFFLQKISSSEYSIREVSKGALTQARAKLEPWAFARLNEVASEQFYASSEHYTWHGHRLLAVDGSTVVLPNHKSIREEFGQASFGPKADSKRSLAIISMLYDVLNQIVLDGQIGPYKTTNQKSGSERALLQNHLPRLAPADLLLLDRGYPSLHLFFELSALKVNFCVRMKTGWWKLVREFLATGEKEGIVEFELPEKDYPKMAKYPEFTERTIRCRLTRIELEGGETEVLCTNLLDTEKYPYEDFADLYHLRWNEEEAYKLLKNRIELENFTGKTARAVKQDFFAKIFLMTLTAAFAFPVEERVRAEYKADQNRQYSQQINRTNSISKMRDILVGLFFKHDYLNALRSFDDIVYRTRELIRPKRKNQRNHRKKKPYSMNYKRL